MPKRTKEYDNVFKTLKMKHKRLFIPIINDAFGKNFPMNAVVEVLPSEGYLTEGETRVCVPGRQAVCGLGRRPCLSPHA